MHLCVPTSSTVTSQFRCIGMYFIFMESDGQMMEQSKLILPLVSSPQTCNFEHIVYVLVIKGTMIALRNLHFNRERKYVTVYAFIIPKTVEHNISSNSEMVF